MYGNVISSALTQAVEGNGLQAGGLDSGGNSGRVSDFKGNRAAVHRAGGGGGASQNIRGRIRALLIAGSAMKVAGAGVDEFLEPLRFSEYVSCGKQLQYRSRAQLSGAVHVAVVARDQHSQVAALVRRTQPMAQLLGQLDALVLVAMVLRPQLL